MYRNKLTLAVSKFPIRKMKTLPRSGGISRFRNIVRVSPGKKFARAFWKIHQFFKVLSDVCTSEAEMYITIIFQTFQKRPKILFLFLFFSLSLLNNDVSSWNLYDTENYICLLIIRSLMRRNEFEEYITSDRWHAS